MTPAADMAVPKGDPQSLMGPVIKCNLTAIPPDSKIEKKLAKNIFA